jgi:hypothetical protein
MAVATFNKFYKLVRLIEQADFSNSCNAGAKAGGQGEEHGCRMLTSTQRHPSRHSTRIVLVRTRSLY